MRKTKIVCTIGPSSDSPEVLRELITGGMNVARLNFSHGTHADHGEKIRLIRELSEQLGKPVAILQDLAGPKIRVGVIPSPGIRLEPGKSVVLTVDDYLTDSDKIPVSYPYLAQDVKEGDRILLADGTMELVVSRTTENDIHCKVITGGLLTSHKGVNLPTGTLRAPALTEKDRDDLHFGLEKDVDYVALSFVKSAQDIREIREIIQSEGKATPVIAKIEKHEAVANIDEILDAADGIMVARGDLGVEIPPESVPLLQKNFISLANLRGKPVITATQMLRSMVESPSPTRAEATDVANAVLDGTDAVMLSEETASGKYPVQAVKFMNRIAEAAEEGFDHEKFLGSLPRRNVPESVARVSCLLAHDLAAAAIVAPTKSGASAQFISRFRPEQPILALSPDVKTVRKLTLYWGVFPFEASEPGNTDELIEAAARESINRGMAKSGDIVIITAGHPVWVKGTTNMLRVKRL